jgi:SAM-dependent methyltransferase
MDDWRYYDITHRHHVVCNPTSIGKLDELGALLGLGTQTTVLDIACGKGELLARLAEQYGTRGVGVDLSPYHIADARATIAARVPDGRVALVEIDGAQYRPAAGMLFDAAICLGASWIWNGYRGTLEALAAMTRPGGWVVSGEPYWKREPAPEYVAAVEVTREMFGTHEENAAAGADLGLELGYAFMSSDDEWARYEGLQWHAALEWAADNPDDPDRDEVLAKMRRERDAYFRWGREALGWGIYLFRKNG